jgi:hypothetical protein
MSLCLLVVLGLNVARAATAGAVIWSDPLNGAETTLTGTAPRDRGGVGANLWTGNARGVFRANGRVEGRGSSGVFLPFTPEAGKIYTLSADIDTAGGGVSFISLGFAGGSGDDAFVAPSVNGYGTIIVRQDRGASWGKYYSGAGAAGDRAFANTAGPQRLKIVLDATRDDPASWTVTFHSNGAPLAGPVTSARGRGFAQIRYVGLTRMPEATGIVKNFELRERPAAILTLPFGACFTEGDAIAGTVAASDESNRETAMRVAWTITDLSGDRVHEQTLSHWFLGSAKLPVSFCEKHLQPGFYTLTAHLTIGDAAAVTRQHRFGIFSKELSARTEIPPWIGMCTQLQQMRPKLEDTPHAFRDVYQLCRFLGVRCTREMFLWAEFEPDIGRYTWEKPDSLLAAAKETDIRIIACLAWWNPAYRRHPDYKHVPVCLTAEGREIWVDRYARVLFERYREDVKAWEIWNEPNAFWNEDPKKATQFAGGIGSPANYADLFLRAWQAGRDVDASLRVMPTLATSNMTADMKELFRLGVGPSLDGMIIHSYGNHEARMDEIVRVLEAHGAGAIPLYSTEVGFACETGNVADEKRQAVNVVETMLSTVKFPQTRGVAWFCLTDWLLPRFGLFDRGMEPKPGAMAFHTVAHLLGVPLSVDNGIQGDVAWYRVERENDRMLWALWRESGEGAVHVRAKDSAPLTVWEFTGNKRTLAQDAGDIGLEVGPLPIFIEGDLELIKTATISLAPLPGKKILVRVSGSFMPGLEAVLKVELPDHAFSETRAVTFSEDGGEFVVSPDDLPMGEQIPVRVALSGMGREIAYRGQVEVSQAFRVSKAEAASLYPPDHLEGWSVSGSNQYFHAGTGNYTGADDCSADVRFGWTDEQLILWLTVTDDVFVPVDPQVPWAADGPQLAIDVDHRKSRNAPFFEFQMGIAKSGPIAWIMDHLHIKPELLAKREGNTTHFRLAVDFGEMGTVPGIGKILGASLCINDSDDGKRNGWLYWGKGIALEKNAAGFRDLVLAPRQD